ncbi:hypothetical protein [Promicromonospora sp. NFX87]|uniref:hypothetical protein n=1 Tax=Promicromonospora sp. NFX87 TaxID=3402691 RepID=UPI003AFA4783
MTTPANHLRAVLEFELDDTFVILPLSASPVIPTGKHGVMPYRSTVNPLIGLLGNGNIRNNTFMVHVISPLANMVTAQAELNDALDAVLDALETDQSLEWTEAVFERYNDVLWCYTISLTIASSHTPDVPADLEEA